MNDYSYVAVLLPALNEESAIRSTVKHVQETLPNCQIIVIDNGSSDHTAIVAQEAGAEVFLEIRKGKGLAFRRGLTEVRNDVKYVLMIDADDTYEIRRANEAIKLMEESKVGMYIGNRIPVFELNRQPAYRNGHQAGNSLLTKLYQHLFNIRIEDSLSGWRLMSRHFTETFPSREQGFALEAELNAHAYVLNCGIGNIDV